MHTESERYLKLRFLRFARQEFLHISKAPPLFRHDYLRLTAMIDSMRASDYLTRAQAATLNAHAAKSLASAFVGETGINREDCIAAM
jgi:Tfp pilus assembly protein PilN